MHIQNKLYVSVNVTLRIGIVGINYVQRGKKHVINSFSTMGERVDFSSRHISRSDCKELAVWSLIYTVKRQNDKNISWYERVEFAAALRGRVYKVGAGTPNLDPSKIKEFADSNFHFFIIGSSIYMRILGQFPPPPFSAFSPIFHISDHF